MKRLLKTFKDQITFLSRKADHQVGQSINCFIGCMSLFLSLVPFSFSTLISLFSLSPSMPRMSRTLSPSSAHYYLPYNVPIMIIRFIMIMIMIIRFIMIMIITSHLLYLPSSAFFSFSVLYAMFDLVSTLSPQHSKHKLNS